MKMNKEELIKEYGSNMETIFECLEAMLDDVRAGGFQDGYDTCMEEHIDD